MKRMIAAVLALILGFSPVMGYAQTKPDVKGFDQSVFDYHFSKADRELTPDQWMSQARRGASLAVNAWELFATDLYENPLVFEQAKKQIEDWSEQELEERFFQWLSNRFFASATETSAENMAESFKDAHLRYTYHLDADGNILFDEETGDALLIRPTDQDYNFFDDLSEWRIDIKRDASAEVNSFESELARMYPELLAYIPEAQRESLGAKLLAAGNSTVNALRQEFERSISREERAFVSRRTGDILSLRKKSNDEAAKYITAQLIAGAEAETNRGIADLNQRIEEAQAGTGDLALQGEEWLAMFQEQFERGLKAWEDAEERFFIRRIEWEQDSDRLFSEGNDVWLAAYEQLKEESNNWELKTKELLDSGKALFANASANLEKAIEDAQNELDLNIKIRTQSGTAKAEALVDMYLTCASTSMKALENTEFWLMQYGITELPATDEDKFDEWIASEWRKVWELAVQMYTEQPEYISDKQAQYRALNAPSFFSIFYPGLTAQEWLAEFDIKHSVLFTMEDFAKGETDFLQELQFAKGLDDKFRTVASKLTCLQEAKIGFALYNSYTAKTLETRNNLMSEYSELFGTGVLKDILAKDKSSEDFVLDEYQIALVKANAVLVYWERQTAIAQAVVDYANDVGAGRMTDAEGVQAWNAAKANYEYAVAQYQIELEELTALGKNVKEISDDLDEFATKMNDAQKELNKISNEYSMILQASMQQYDIYALKEIEGGYFALLEKYNQLYNSSGSAIYQSSIETLVKIAAAQNFLEVSEYLNSLLGDDDEENEALRAADIALFTDDPYFAARENLANATQALNELFESYSVEANGDFLPNIQDICDAVLEKEGDFTVNAAKFLFDLDKALDMLPSLIADKLSRWKDALMRRISFSAFAAGKKPAKDLYALDEEFDDIYSRVNDLKEYVASISSFDDKISMEVYDRNQKIADDKALLDYQWFIIKFWEIYQSEKNAVETQDLKHWRQYITSEYIRGEITIPSAYTWMSGTKYDLDVQSQFWGGYANDLLSLYSTGYNARIEESIATLEDAYNSETNYWLTILNNSYNLMDYIGYYGRTYDLSKLASAETDAKLTNLNALREIQIAALNAANSDYSEKADEFASAGIAYDLQYTQSKTAFNDMEEKRFLLEVQDAIQRWAGTAYLSTEKEELADCKESLQRAQVVFEVLSNLYNNEDRREYNNSTYDSLYAEYEQSYALLLRTMKANSALAAELESEKMFNAQTFTEYYRLIHSLGLVPEYTDDYVSPTDPSKWTLADIITVGEDGILRFAKGNDGSLVGLNAADSKVLQDYFNTKTATGNETFEQSQFDLALKNLSERMAGYFVVSGQYEQWALARDYLLQTLVGGNSALGFISGNLKQADNLRANTSMGNREYVDMWLYKRCIHRYVSDLQSGIDIDQKNAWENLSAEEKADLEFYVIITLSDNCNDYAEGFSWFRTFIEYRSTYDMVRGYYEEAKKVSKFWLLDPSLLRYLAVKDENENVMDDLWPGYDGAQKYYNAWKNGLDTNISKANTYAEAYAVSCDRLAVLQSNVNEGDTVNWEKIETVLEMMGSLKADDIAALKLDWDTMQNELQKKEVAANYASVPDAIEQLVQWAKDTRDASKIAFEQQWKKDNEERQSKEADFDKLVSNFINGTGSRTDLEIAARAAFGNEAAAWKNHLEGFGKILFNNLDILADCDEFYQTEYDLLKNEIAALFTQTLQYTYDAETAARKVEWEMQRQDIAKKEADWEKSVAGILEKGRQDWLDGIQRMEEAYSRWVSNFKSEYEKVSTAWADAYLAGLEDKEDWLAQAAAAANNASSEAFLSIVGADAERLARTLDTRNPLGILGMDTSEAGEILAGLLDKPGIGNLSSIFDSIGTVSTISDANVRRGMGNGIWDAANIKATASELAHASSADLAAQESKKLAYNVRMNVDASISALHANIDSANKSFRKNMDDMFVFKGQWNKNGNGYSKNIIVASTLFNPVITEEKWIEGYKDYSYGSVVLNTNISDNVLEGIDYRTAMGLIGNVQLEIQSIMADIFGSGKESESIDDTRTQSPGAFGTHIGYDPLVKPDDQISKTENYDDVFTDRGSGELGRLLADFIWWQIIEGQGVAKLSMAPWDRPMWDDRNSSFEAPTLRSAAEFVGQVAVAVVGAVLTPVTGGASIAGAMLLSVAINSADDLTFAGLDVAYGYKTWEQAGTDFGKAVAINTVSAVGSGVFSGVGGVTDGFFSGGLTGALTKDLGTWSSLAIQTGMTGAQSLTIGTINNALGAVTYNGEKGKLEFNNDAFNAGFRQTGISVLSGMTSTSVSGSLGNWNTGANNNKLTGFSNLNIENVGKLNGLVGGLAGQAVEYGFNKEYTLNLANLSMLGIKGSNGSNVSMGLLELKLGENGTSMKIGSGGANVSIDNVIGAIQGAMVWDVNNRIAKNDFGAKIALRAQYGYGDAVQKDQLKDILKGKVEINTNANGDYTAETTMVDGKRVINLTGYNSDMSPADEMRLAVTLGHEAYRDGIVTADNKIETQTATFAHTAMLDRMLDDKQMVTLDVGLIKDLMAYDQYKASGDISSFNNYVDNNYDSSADYWKLTSEGNIIFDGSKNLYDKDGNLLKEYTGDGGYTASLADVLGVSFNEADQMLKNAGLTWDGNTFRTNQGVDAKNNYDIQIKALDRFYEQISPQPSPVIAEAVLDALPDVKPGILYSLDGIGSTIQNGLDTAVSGLKNAVDGIGGLVNNTKSAITSMSEKVGSAFTKRLKISQPAAQEYSQVITASVEENLSSADKYVHVPGNNVKGFWEGAMPDPANCENKAIEKRGPDGELLRYENGYAKLDTFCNTFAKALIDKNFEQGLDEKIYQGSKKDTNGLFEEFKTNPNLERFDPADYTTNGVFDDKGFMTNIQDMANNGVLIILLTKNDEYPGHIAFVGSSDLTLSSYQPPSYPKAAYEDGKTTGNDLRKDYADECHVVIVHAGSYTGITSVVYATMKWTDPDERKKLLNESLYFYAVKTGGN